MNVLILNGSPKKNGKTAKILRHIAEAMDPSYNIETVNTYDLSIKPCTGCHRCRPDRECVLDEDDAQIVGRKINQADILIVGSPCYWGNMSGTLKNLIDRSVTTFEIIPDGKMSTPRQKGKKAVIVTTSGSPWPFNQLSSQAKGTIHSLKIVLKNGGYQIKGVIMYGGANKPGDLPVNIINKATKIGRSL